MAQTLWSRFSKQRRKEGMPKRSWNAGVDTDIRAEGLTDRKKWIPVCGKRRQEYKTHFIYTSTVFVEHFCYPRKLWSIDLFQIYMMRIKKFYFFICLKRGYGLFGMNKKIKSNFSEMLLQDL